ncbi:BMP family ABC transporter substrate-binding protein [Nanchangia anserum]|uniref:BMP family ABC transporter substrate-binding protein n=1 Tax=Nanchangia anserum TaxID=2692125 RepID=A0A8I0GCA6_9ACTO|nr:BMP family ABC transporter substrate-binding protein [Nanchangia anserum]MBD3690133.1 BMP family ABC transporter substrate-binding protein [Nanchangia anserum]QOX82085.1 BMP family ABC transporter substrate-binding protein [Nanchangia anserum]
MTRTRWAALTLCSLAVLATTACGAAGSQSAPSHASSRAPIVCFADSAAAETSVTDAYVAAVKKAATSDSDDKLTVRDPYRAETAKEALDEAAKAGCGTVITTSASMASGARQAARTHDDIVYEAAGIALSDKNPANLVALNMGFDQPAFLAGYAAAGTTRSGIVGVISASTETSRTVEGFAAGVDFYNQAKGTGVVVNGWNAATKKAGAATSDAEVRAQVGTQVGQKADIILVDADAYSPAALAALTDVDSEVSVVFVGEDAWETHADSRDAIMTSLVPDPDALAGPMLAVARLDRVHAGSDVGFTRTYSSAHLADFRSWGVRLNDELVHDIDSLRAQLAKGDIVIGETSK